MSGETVCPYCVVGFPESFCLWPGDCSRTAGRESDSEESAFAVISGESETGGPNQSEFEEDSGRIYKDAISTGRKRAAALYPIGVGQVCEWAWRKDCGGGIIPVFGCTGRPATNIHHGPDKSTLNNARENISVICTFCHNRWHAANDKFYPQPRPVNGEEWLPIPPEGKEIKPLAGMVKADKAEILLEEMKIPEGGKDRVS